MTWFDDLTGIENETPDSVRETLTLQGSVLISSVNGRRFDAGTLEIPRLSELRDSVAIPDQSPLTLEGMVADVQALHLEPRNAGALFQVASQFNLLEMTDPSVLPEDGIAGYENDHTQGPACAIACGAGTIYRNYFVPILGEVGQSRARQIDCLADLGQGLRNHENAYWVMENGYAMPADAEGLKLLKKSISKLPEKALETLRGLILFGIQRDTEVTLDGGGHLVSQIYCSAMPVAYGSFPTDDWAPIANLVLEAAYEATLLAGIQNYARTGNNLVYLTMLGGGAFGNRPEWIANAVIRALERVRNSGLRVVLVSYGQTSALAGETLDRWKSQQV